VSDDDNAGTLSKRLVAEGLPALGETLARLDAGDVQGLAPDLEQGSYEPPVRQTELDWDQPFERIDRLVRAGHPDQPPYFTYRGRRRYVYALRRVGPRVGKRPGVLGSGRDGEMPAAVRDALVAVRWRPVGHTHAVRPLAKQQFP
jgi:methionyl-tRNA formyltransferase